MFVDSDEHIGLGVVSGGAAAGDVIKHRTETRRTALAAVGRVAADGHPRLFVQPELAHIHRVKEQDATFALNPAVAVPAGIDRRVVLVVRAQGHEAQVAGSDGQVGQRIDAEIGPACGRFPFAVGGGIAQLESARPADLRVVIIKLGNDRLDALADAVVVGDQRIPIDRTPGKKRLA